MPRDLNLKDYFITTGPHRIADTAELELQTLGTVPVKGVARDSADEIKVVEPCEFMIENLTICDAV